MYFLLTLRTELAVDSAQSNGSTHRPPLHICAALTAVCVAIALHRPAVAAARPPSRSFADFESFWPLYVQQHSLTTTKLLHGVGTTLVVLSIAVRLGAASSLRVGLGFASGSYLR